MRPYIFYLLCFAFAYSASHAQQPTRVSALPSDDTWVTNTYALPGGRQYNTGYFSRTVDFDPDPNQEQIYHSRGGWAVTENNRDVFIQVLNWDGSLAWAWVFGTKYEDEMTDAVVDPCGNLYVTGNVSPWGEYYLAPGDEEYRYEDQRGAFLAKFSLAGKLEWAIQAKAHRPTSRTRLSESNSVVFDPQGNVTWSGSFVAGGMDFITPQGELFLTAEVYPDSILGKNGFVVNVDPNGEVNWVKDFGHGGDIKSAMTAYDEEGNLFVGGAFEGNCDFDPSNGTNNPNFFPFNSWDSYLMKLDLEGEFEWVRYIRSDGIDWTNDLAIDQEGNVIVVGAYDGTIDLDPGEDSIFVTNERTNRLASYMVKLDGEGNYLLGKTIGNSGEGGVQINNVEVDELGQIYFSAAHYRKTDIDMGPGVVMVEGIAGGIVEKLSSDGNLIWWKYLPRASRYPFGLSAFHVIGEDQFALGGRYSAHYDSVPGTDSTYLPVPSGGAGFSTLWGIEPESSWSGSELDLAPCQDSGELLEGGYNLYPNPNQGEFTFKLEGYHPNIFIEIFDMHGKKVYEVEKGFEPASFLDRTIPIDLELPSGMYVFRFSSAGRVRSIRLLIQ